MGCFCWFRAAGRVTTRQIAWLFSFHAEFANSHRPEARRFRDSVQKNVLSRIADALFNPSFGFGSPQSILLICFRQFWEPPFAVGNRFHTDGSGPVAAFENLFIFPRIGWFGLLNGVSTSSLDVEAESSLVRGRIAHVRRRRTCATKVLGTSPSSTAFLRRLPPPPSLAASGPNVDSTPHPACRPLSHFPEQI